MSRYRNALLILGAASLWAILASGCTDLKPTQEQIDDLKSQIGLLSLKIKSTDSQAMAAADSARPAAATAQQAKNTADRAQLNVKSNQQGIEAINEKLDRMFKKSVSK